MTAFREDLVRRDAGGRFAATSTGETSLDEDDSRSALYDPASKTYARMSVEDQGAWQREAREGLAQMPKTHAAALRRHTNENFHHTTSYLRGVPGARQVSERHIATLDKAIANGGDGVERVLFRGIRLPRTDDDDAAVVAEHFRVGETVRDPSFVSTSANPQCALNLSGAQRSNAETVAVVMEIRSGAGVQVPNDDWWEETETLLPRNAPMRVEAVHTDRSFTSDSGRAYPAIVVQLSHESD